MRPAATRTRRSILPILAVLLATIPAARAEDWPCFRGPGRQGISLEKGVPTQWSAASNVRWKTPIPGDGWSSPIVSGDNLFVTTATDGGKSLHLLRLNRRDGKIVWDKEIAQQEAGHRQRLNSYATPTPATDGRQIYVPAFDGRVLAVDLDGRIVWTNDDFDYYSEHGLGVSPVLHGDLVIMAFDWSSPGPEKKVGWQIPWDKAVILAIDRNTGKTRWKGSRGSSRIGHVTPQVATVSGQEQLITAAGDVIQGFDLKTGARLWTVSSPGEGVVPSVVVGGGLCFTASGFGESTIRAVRIDGRGDVTQTHIAWQTTDDVPHVPSMLYVAPHLYSLTEAGILKCFNGATGEVLWRQRLAGKFSASPVYADGKVYFLSEKGKTTVIEEGPQYKVAVENDLGETCCASPAISQGNIFIRTDKTLYCIGN
jgi:outer membrane protein assembly factor BamB